ncbi:MAG: DUF58 domain-containing protein [Mucilaginibacter polytrichastri]|nr:DUF58 domain-containing protein [Mucilaginibacter polytrichastri]
MATLRDYTELQHLGRLDLLAQQVVEGFITGLHQSPFHGFSVEFAEHRQYNTGESAQHVDWRLFARTDKLFVKQFEEETNLRCQLLLDTSSSMHYPDQGLSKLHFAVYAAASLMYLFKKQRDAFGLHLFDSRIHFSSAARSTGQHMHYLFSELEKLLHALRPENRTTQLADTLHHIAEQVHKRSMVILFSDLLDDPTQTEQLIPALQHLRHNRHEVIIFNISDKRSELDFDFDNRPHRFFDLESGEQMRVHPAQLREHYQQAAAAFRAGIIEKCAQNKVDLIDADTAEGFYPILHAWLIRRNKMI